jgi:hypothetical protein
MIHFTGATRMQHPRDMAAYNAKRYKWVKKQLGPTDACLSGQDVVVYSFGTLYGQWPGRGRVQRQPLRGPVRGA